MMRALLQKWEDMGRIGPGAMKSSSRRCELTQTVESLKCHTKGLAFIWQELSVFVKLATLPGLGRLKGHVEVSSIFLKFGFIPRSGRRLIFEYLPLMWQRTTSIHFQLIFNQKPSVGWYSHFIARTLRVKQLTTETDYFSTKSLFLVQEGLLPTQKSFSQHSGQSPFFFLSFQQTCGRLGGFLKMC